MTDILFSFRRCPYAMRARWALLMTNQFVVLREVLLSKKPKELLKFSPKGTVPVLVTDNGFVIEESLDIMRWALNKYDPTNILFNGDKEAQNEINSMIKLNDGMFKYSLDRYKYSQLYIASEREQHQKNARKILLDWNLRLSLSKNGFWLVKDQESLADWCIWPFVRQYRIANPNCFDEDKELGAVKKWLDFYLTHKNYSQLMKK